MIRKLLVCALVIMSGLVLSGCAGVEQKPVPKREAVWPLPPEKARYKLVAEYWGRRDLEDSDMLKFLGQQEDVFLERPHGIVADNKGNIFVSDIKKLKIFVFDFEKKKFRIIGDTGIKKVVIPLGLAIDNKNGLLFVADGSLKQVLAYDKDSGDLKLVIGQQPGTFQRPVTVAVNPSTRRIYVGDAKLQQVKVFDYEAKLLFSIGKEGQRIENDEGFNVPSQIALDRAGNLYVADMFNRFIKKFSPDGKFIGKIGLGTGLGSGYFSKLVGVAIDSEDHVYGLDTEFCNFQAFDQQNRLLLAVGEPGNGPQRMFMPTNIFIDEKDRIYITDTGNSMIKVIQYLGETGGQ